MTARPVADVFFEQIADALKPLPCVFEVLFTVIAIVFLGINQRVIAISKPRLR